MPTEDERAAIAEQYGWASEEERAADYAELAERTRRIKSDEMLQWCRGRNAQRRRDDVNFKSTGAGQIEPARKPERDRSTMQTDRAWNDWAAGKIQRAIKAHEKVLLSAIGDVLLEERQAHEKAMTELRARLDEVNARLDRIDQERGAWTPPHLRAV